MRALPFSRVAVAVSAYPVNSASVITFVQAACVAPLITTKATPNAELFTHSFPGLCSQCFTISQDISKVAKPLAALLLRDSLNPMKDLAPVGLTLNRPITGAPH